MCRMLTGDRDARVNELPDLGIGLGNSPSWADEQEIDSFERFVEEFWEAEHRFKLETGPGECAA